MTEEQNKLIELQVESNKMQAEMLDISKSMYKQMREMNVRLQETLKKLSD